MVLGTTRILLRLTEGDEFGVYRINENKQRFLLLAFDDQKEAIKCGKMIAAFLHVSLDNHLPAQMLSSSGGFNLVNTQTKRPSVYEKPKIHKVRGISQLCQELLYKNTPKEEILRIIIEKYLAAGRDEAYAKSSAEWYLRAAKS